MKKTYYIISLGKFEHDRIYETYEEAIKWARDYKNSNYKEVKLYKVEKEEIEI